MHEVPYWHFSEVPRPLVLGVVEMGLQWRTSLHPHQAHRCPSAGTHANCFDARFTLAVRTPAFGPFAFRTLVPSDACHHRHWSLSAPSLLARDGARNHSINRTVQRSTKPPVPEFFVRLARWAASLGSRTSYARWDNGHKGNSPENGTCGTISGSKPQAGVQMASQWELSARAALCRQLAKREPKSRVFWMAEAENWSRLSNESFRGEPEQKSVAACCERSRLSDGLGREAE